MAGRVTRFAPSPTGPLHLGHAFSALTVWQRAAGGTALLRIEDIDRSRCRPEWEAQIFNDLHWLGLAWPEPVLRQSDRGGAYRAALDRLTAMGLTYPCRCSRADIRAALAAPQEGVPVGPDGIVYPGTCRGRPMAEAGPDDAIRLDMARAEEHAGGLRFHETSPEAEGWHAPQNLARSVGDVMLARRGFGTSYHLAVVVDDAAQGVTEVVRGADLFEATAIHVLLQRLLGLPVPDFHHHRLIRDAAGKRLAKRDDSKALAKYRAEGMSPAEVRALVGF
ncbi:tRNA glutamyl-Q(34) synthetase GluQRS [Cereibacter sphaeroides]|uniref:tRNA glutamyl-Q(34) synthetase GluQRS n=1 Tax=Cereibacter sphaeroides TaxID=1063 RepID=UPI000191C3A7|nr:tRNA glutamyl-Q(34) synthetase GluQRS [Cereibacter sphaeroides]ACM00799.1 Glutamyl-tRNA synthetase, class Ic [Cereibacter sphaeroides KD131]